jgi:hypothetical protein
LSSGAMGVGKPIIAPFTYALRLSISAKEKCLASIFSTLRQSMPATVDSACGPGSVAAKTGELRANAPTNNIDLSKISKPFAKKFQSPSISILKPGLRRSRRGRIGLRWFAKFRNGRFIVIVALLRFFVPDFEFFLRIFASGIFLLRLIARLDHGSYTIAASRFLGTGGRNPKRQHQREQRQAGFLRLFSFATYD